MEKIAMILIVFLLILTACSQITQYDAVNETADEDIFASTPSMDSPHFDLTYTHFGQFEPLHEVQPNDQQILLRSEKINDLQFDFYYKNEADTDIYVSMHINTTTYELGQIAYIRMEDDVTITYVTANSMPLIKVNGYCGANCPISMYVTADTASPALLRIEANTVETDVDDDGLPEIVATVGTAPQTTIYKMENDRIIAANINEIMNAPAVLYDRDKNVFQVATVPGEISAWKISGRSLHKS